jgi:hypothetical protein
MAIKGKIAQILDNYRVVLNKGSRDGVTAGMRFVIFQEGDDIIDPETKQSLGKLEIVKGAVTAEHVQESLTVAVTEHKPEDARAKTLSELMVEASVTDDPRLRLNVRPESIRGVPLAGPVKTGDDVRSV